MKKKIIFSIILISTLFLLTGCITKNINDIKSEDYLGKQVYVHGTVENTLKIGELSGFTLKDKNGDTIWVRSDSLPKEGSEITVKGVVMKEILVGYYILRND